jgi:integrase
MPRPTKTGAPAGPPRHRKLTDFVVRNIRPEHRAFNIWDVEQRGLVLRVQPSGHKSFRVFYRHNNRPRWLHLENALAITLDAARDLAAETRLAARRGKDPAAERKAERSSGTFGELAIAYRERYARKENKSWKQAAALVDRYLLPRWNKLPAKDISRADVRATMAKIEAPMLANQVLAAASAIFSWGMREDFITITINPCRGVERNKTRSRERILADSEVPLFWKAFDEAGLIRSCALKMILLTGQRPGEVAHMRYENIVDGWWQMPGEPDRKTQWPGTKNGAAHRIWLPAAVHMVFAELAEDDASQGFVFPGSRGHAVNKLDVAMAAICKKVGVERTTPHDLRRTHGSTITKLGFGRDAMNRIQNHKEGGIADVYDRHRYEVENKNLMEKVADHIISLVEGRADQKVVAGKFASRRCFAARYGL